MFGLIFSSKDTRINLRNVPKLQAGNTTSQAQEAVSFIFIAMTTSDPIYM
jgi:hypothetical protein